MLLSPRELALTVAVLPLRLKLMLAKPFGDPEVPEKPLPSSAALKAVLAGVTAVHAALWAIAAGTKVSRAIARTARKLHFFITTHLLLSRFVHFEASPARAISALQVRCAHP